MPATFLNIESLDALDDLFKRSHGGPVVIFKHSSTCGISMHVKELITDVKGNINLIVVQQNRDISNAVEARTGHRHQSPQAFVIRDGKAVYHASHYGIDPEMINQHLLNEL